MTGSVSKMAQLEPKINYEEIQGRDSFLGATEREYANVSVKGFGTYRLRSLTELERSQLESEMVDRDGIEQRGARQSMRRKLIRMSICDGNGNLLLTEDDEDQVAKINGRLAGALFRKAMELSGYTDDDFEEQAKN